MSDAIVANAVTDWRPKFQSALPPGWTVVGWSINAGTRSRSIYELEVELESLYPVRGRHRVKLVFSADTPRFDQDALAAYLKACEASVDIGSVLAVSHDAR